MLRFTPPPKQAVEQTTNIKKEVQEELLPILDGFMAQFVELPSITVLHFSKEQTDLIKSQMLAFLTQKVESAPKAAISFAQGTYDNIIFADSLKIKPGFQDMINKDNREFVMRLFYKCSSSKQLEFWIGNSYAKLPKDSVALAVSLGNNIHVLQYLKTQGWFENLTSEDKVKLISRAKRFQNEGLAYLEKEFNLAAKTSTSSLNSSVRS